MRYKALSRLNYFFLNGDYQPHVVLDEGQRQARTLRLRYIPTLLNGMIKSRVAIKRSSDPETFIGRFHYSIMFSTIVKSGIFNHSGLLILLASRLMRFYKRIIF